MSLLLASPGLHAQSVWAEPDSPDGMPRLDVGQRSRSHRLLGAGAGFVLGAGATYLVLHSGGSTAPCDRDANQDAMSSGECFALTVAGGLAGAGLGAIAGGFFRSERGRGVPLDGLHVGWIPGRGGRIGISIGWGRQGRTARPERAPGVPE